MLDQVEVKETATNKEGFFKGAIDAAEQVARVGMRVERLKKTAANAIDDGVVDAKRMVKRGVYAAEDRRRYGSSDKERTASFGRHHVRRWPRHWRRYRMAGRA